MAVIPTRNIVPVALLVVAMWYAGASQSNGAAYLLCFLVVGMVAVSGLHAVFNVAGLEVVVDAVPSGFVGQEVSLPIEVINRGRRPRHGIEVMHAGETMLLPEIKEWGAARNELRFPPDQRGLHTLETLKLRSRFPLGFFRVGRRVSVRCEYLVYPLPAGNPRFPVKMASDEASSSIGVSHEGDDFHGLRAYVLGESQRHIDWRAVARGQPLLIKQFAAESGGRLEFDWNTSSSLDYEARISQFTLWVLEAERQQKAYGLILPSGTLPCATGRAHFHRCLRELALMPEETTVS